MHRIPRFLILLLIGWTAACAPTLQQVQVPPQPNQIEFRVDLLAHLARIQREFAVETALCVYGRVAGDTIWVDGVEPTRIVKEERERVVFAGCGAPHHLGVWHLHPTEEGDTVPCGFSAEDVLMLEGHRAILGMVSCSGGRVAWRLGSRYGSLTLAHP